MKDFKLHAYQGDGSLGSGDVQFSNVFAYRLPVIVNIWAPLCAPCRQEMPAFQRVSDDYAGRAYFMGLDLGTYMGLGNQAQAVQFLKDIGVNYPNAYPVDAAGDIKETGGGVSLVSDGANIDPGGTQTRSVDLAPGKYLFVCNIPGHFKQGMYEIVIVTK